MRRCGANVDRVTLETANADNGPLLREPVVAAGSSGRNESSMISRQADLRWRDAAHGSRKPWPAALGDWLLSQDSLTRRLRARCQGEFRVSILRQGWGWPSASERRALKLAPRSRAWIREVHLWCGTEPWVSARTVIPVTTLTGRRRRLSRLGTRPLGEVIFTDLSIRRGPVEIARAECAGLVPPQGSSRAAATVWGRRSVFWLQEKPLLVCEFFLPDMPGALE